VLTNGTRRAGASPGGARQLEDEGYVLPRPRVAFVMARPCPQPQRDVVPSRPTVAVLPLAIDDAAPEGG